MLIFVTLCFPFLLSGRNIGCLRKEVISVFLLRLFKGLGLIGFFKMSKPI